MKIYFIFDGNKHEGPFSIEELQAKGIKRDTFVWKEGLPDWVHAEKVEELEYILPAPIVVEVPKPPAYPPPDPVAEEKTTTTVTENKAEEKKDTGAKLIIQEEPKVAAKQKFSVADEAKKETRPKVTSGAQKKKSNALVYIILAVVVLGGGGGYYLYSQNQAKKEKTGSQTTNPSLLVPDSAGTINDADATAANNGETTGTVKTDDTNKEDVNAVKEEEKNKTPDNKDKTAKTDTKANTRTDTKTNKTTETIPVPDVKQKSEKATPDVVVEKKTANPMDNLSVSGSYKKNLFGEGVMEGKIHNNNNDVKFSKVVIEATYINSSGTTIKSEQFTKNGNLNPNDNVSFKFKINPPKDLKSVNYRIVSAQ